MMNLTADAWIPAVRPDGTRVLLSLEELFTSADKLRDLSVRPHERVALMRLLICITQAALDGPEDRDDWETCRKHIAGKAAHYLTKWKAGFELFGDGPRFLQVPELRPGKDSDDGNPATKLDIALASGNNPTLFDNRAGEFRTQSPEKLALTLLSFQCFAPGGRIGVARWNGQETAGKGSSNHAPCTPSSMLHAFVLGENLLATIHLNLLTRAVVLDNYGPQGWGKPIWEEPVKTLHDKAAIRNATMTYLGRLVPVSRAIRLNPDGRSIVLANGLDYPVFQEYREPTATVIARKEETALLPASTARSIWRQLPAMTVRSRSATANGGPLALNNLEQPGDTTLWAGALITDKAKIEDLVESAYTLPSSLFTDLGRTAYMAGLGYADEAESVLAKALKDYASTMKIDTPAYDRGRRYFWTFLEQHLSALMQVARDLTPPEKISGCSWGKAVRQACQEAYEQASARQSARQLKAFASGWSRLQRYFAAKPQNQAHE